MRLTIGMKLTVGFILVLMLIASIMYVGLSGFAKIGQAYELELARMAALSGIEFDIQESVAATTGRSTKLMWGLALLAIMGAVAVQYILTRGIAGPVRQAAAAALRLADGDLTIDELQVKTGDEIEDMAGAFNRMIVNLRGMMAEIKQMSVALLDHGRSLLAVAHHSTDATTQIAAAIHQVAHGTDNQVQHMQRTGEAMGQLRQAIEQIATGAQRQAQQAEQTSRTLEEMVRSIEEVAASAQQVAEASSHGAERARAGGKAVAQVQEGMEQIRSASRQVAERVDELRNYSLQIGQIVDLIGEIAEQTNLLALNAAIEAARAGEHGRGFGVVADEVRRLAVRSAESTQEIGRIIASIQTAVASSVEVMETGTEQIESGSALARHARAALEEIIEAINTTDDLANTISRAAQQMAASGPEMMQAMSEMASVTEQNTAATEEMSASSDDVVRAIDEVAAISEQTAAGTEEVSASASEVNSAAQNMMHSVQKLNEMAADLEKLVARFTL